MHCNKIYNFQSCVWSFNLMSNITTVMNAEGMMVRTSLIEYVCVYLSFYRLNAVCPITRLAWIVVTFDRQLHKVVVWKSYIVACYHCCNIVNLLHNNLLHTRYYQCLKISLTTFSILLVNTRNIFPWCVMIKDIHRLKYFNAVGRNSTY